MSTYFEAWGSTVASCPDPASWTPENRPVVGRTVAGKPITQGLEAGAYTWVYMTTAEYEALWDRWNANKGTSGAFKVPDRSDSDPEDWRTVTAFGEEPSGDFAQRGRNNVTMRIVITA